MELGRIRTADLLVRSNPIVQPEVQERWLFFQVFLLPADFAQFL
jgi:hypothetical protein